ncbi:hypothetical protein JD844_020814 [Phrynosoma platyrhinos]|uniref:Uncharacterized protein n=1 Tax=Phrynosoma platyrhinos TaxID=52577 RepID=A0ABQ7SSX6_PHRPL|nr:hypothetical protein JD844_020814 [Phrynosoma platyrhinos]
MTTQITVPRNSQAGTIGHEDYSLYSSMSEDELIQMAIEQSLTEDPTEQVAAQKNIMAAAPREQVIANPHCNHNPPFPVYPWQRIFLTISFMPSSLQKRCTVQRPDSGFQLRVISRGKTEVQRHLVRLTPARSGGNEDFT